VQCSKEITERRSPDDPETAFEEANGIIPSTPPTCTSGPSDASPEEQAFAKANGITLSGPIACTFDDRAVDIAERQSPDDPEIAFEEANGIIPSTPPTCTSIYELL
jgi:hypothetical protein